MPKCTNCGKRIKKGERICQFCGTVYHDPNNLDTLTNSSSVDFFAGDDSSDNTMDSFQDTVKDDSRYMPPTPETVVEETPVVEEPVVEQPVVETPRVETPVVERVAAPNPYNPIPEDKPANASKKPMKVGVIIAVVLSSIVLCVVAIIASMFAFTTIKEKKEQNARIEWQSKNFPIMDDFYTHKDFAGLERFLQDRSSEDGFYPYAWDHYDLYDVYTEYEEFMEDKDGFWENDELTQKWTLYQAVFVDFASSEDYYSVSDEDKLIIKEWTKDTDDFFRDVLKLDDKEIEEMKAFICNDGSGYPFPSSTQCSEYLRTHF